MMKLRSDWVFLVPIVLAFFLLVYNTPTSEPMRVATMALVGTIITVSSSVYGIVINNRMNKDREMQLRVFEMKANAYSGFFNIITKMLVSAKADELDSNPLAKDFIDFKSKILAWGNEDVVRAVKLIDSEEDSSGEPGGKFNIIISALRKDLGHGDSKSFKPFYLFANDRDRCE